MDLLLFYGWPRVLGKHLNHLLSSVMKMKSNAVAAYWLEFNRYKNIIEKTVAQVSDDQLNHVPFKDGNSIAMIVRHLSGNLLSRFTDFLTTDGEKPWRNREQEFLEGTYERTDLLHNWEKAWFNLEKELSDLGEDDLKKEITIRGVSLLVNEALNRSMAHIAYHAGQVALLGRMYKEEDWQWLSIPRGKSAEYNLNPSLEKPPM